MKLKLLLAAIATSVLGFAANAATIDGTISLSGDVDSYAGSGVGDITVDFDADLGAVLSSTNDFQTLTSGACLSCVTAFDISGSSTGLLFSVGDLSYTSTSFSDFIDTGVGITFVAQGYFSGPGFDNTYAPVTFSVSDVGGITINYSAVAAVPVPAAGFLLLGGLGGLAALRRRK